MADDNGGRCWYVVEEIARGSPTRFLSITQRRRTMGSMDRLCGGTMGERGGSQLVSVDLHAATGMEAAE